MKSPSKLIRPFPLGEDGDFFQRHVISTPQIALKVYKCSVKSTKEPHNAVGSPNYLALSLTISKEYPLSFFAHPTLFHGYKLPRPGEISQGRETGEKGPSLFISAGTSQ